MRVIPASMSNSYEIVVDNSGKKYKDSRGEWSFEPLPVCRIPVGYGRTDDQAVALSDFIISAIDQYCAMVGMTEEIATKRFGLRFRPDTTAAG